MGTWAYLHKILWSWAGILLTVDALVALLERYLGEVVERRLHWKPHVPTSIKISFAVVVLLVAQALAYQDVEEKLIQAGKDNDGLHAAVNSLNGRIDSQEKEINRLRAKPEQPRPRRSAEPDLPERVPDRFLNAEQKDHLYQELKRISDDARQADFITVTITAAYPRDRESSRLAAQLTGIFQDAHWKVISQRVPQLEGRMQYQIPIGIWVLESARHNMALFVESDLINVSLSAEVQPSGVLPPDFKGLIVLIGYKDTPI